MLLQSKNIAFRDEGKVMCCEEDRDEAKMPLNKGIDRVLLESDIGF